jgi:hypothetical protein
LLFFFAMTMGAGPGALLIAPDPASTDPAPSILGLPSVYAWALIWCTALVLIVIAANHFIWSREDDG